MWDDEHYVHLRLATVGEPLREIPGYVTPQKRRGTSGVRYNMLREADGHIWELYPDGTTRFRYYRLNAPQPITYWCQIYPWEARQAALALLLLGRNGALHKDVACMFARAVYCTRHCAEWRRPDTYFLG